MQKVIPQLMWRYGRQIVNGTKQSASNFHSGGATRNVSCVMSPETRATCLRYSMYLSNKSLNEFVHYCGNLILESLYISSMTDSNVFTLQVLEPFLFSEIY